MVLSSIGAAISDGPGKLGPTTNLAAPRLPPKSLLLVNQFTFHQAMPKGVPTRGMEICSNNDANKSLSQHQSSEAVLDSNSSCLRSLPQG